MLSTCVNRKFGIERCATLLGILSFASVPTPALGGLLATATISTSSSSAPFSYTIDLHNTGTTDIGSFWFAWTDVPVDYDFLPSAPTVTNMPTGWFAPVTHNGLPGDGYAIEFYNLVGGPIAPQATGTFAFSSPDPPATIAGNAFIPPNKVSTSFVYVGFPQTDIGYEFNVVLVPEPSGLVLAAGGMSCLGVLARVRKRRQSVVAR